MTSLFKKPSNCKCDGGFRQIGHRWVVIERREAPRSSQLKCLECGWKWWSTCRYVAKLADHVERSRSGMTDQDILYAIKEGAYGVNVKTACVVSWRTGKRVRVIERESNGSTYRFVEICRSGLRKKVALHRLVWMVANGRVVPDGFDVDHIGGKAFGDGIDNLRLLESSVNRSRGKPEAKQEETLF